MKPRPHLLVAATVAWACLGGGAGAAEEELNAQQKQQAAQIAQMFQPVVHAELELVRQACGALEPEARRAIREAANAAADAAAAAFVLRQGQPGGRRQVDLRAKLLEQVGDAVERHAPAAAVRSYRREQQARGERQAELARVRIVAKLDTELDLSAEQRQAILADLRSNWEADWLSELHDPGGMVINGHRPAPDFAAGAITPHLDPRQLDAWRDWARAAGRRQVGLQPPWRFADGPGLLGADPWWSP